MNNSDSQVVHKQAVGPARRGILQIHPSLRCNLSCAHCYSNSGPKLRVELDTAIVCDVVSDAAALGYQVLSVAGGEPLLYGGLYEVLAHAKSLGLRTTVTTNGFFTRQDQLSRLRNLVDVLAISLDGPPHIHNEIRGTLHAFERLEGGLSHVREAAIPFGFIHTLTRQNWEHLLWVAEFAASNGAHLLQIHPLELTGRAKEQMAGEMPTTDMLAKVYILALVLAGKYSGKMQVQLDLLYSEHLREDPSLVYAGESAGEPEQALATQSLGLLVLEADGTIVPSAYGMSRSYKLCNVKEQRLVEAWPSYLAKGYPAFRTLCRRVWEELCAPNGPMLSNWHEMLVSHSHITASNS